MKELPHLELEDSTSRVDFDFLDLDIWISNPVFFSRWIRITLIKYKWKTLCGFWAIGHWVLTREQSLMLMESDIMHQTLGGDMQRKKIEGRRSWRVKKTIIEKEREGGGSGRKRKWKTGLVWEEGRNLRESEKGREGGRERERESHTKYYRVRGGNESKRK